MEQENCWTKKTFIDTFFLNNEYLNRIFFSVLSCSEMTCTVIIKVVNILDSVLSKILQSIIFLWHTTHFTFDKIYTAFVIRIIHNDMRIDKYILTEHHLRTMIILCVLYFDVRIWLNWRKLIWWQHTIWDWHYLFTVNNKKWNTSLCISSVYEFRKSNFSKSLLLMDFNSLNEAIIYHRKWPRSFFSWCLDLLRKVKNEESTIQCMLLQFVIHFFENMILNKKTFFIFCIN